MAEFTAYFDAGGQESDQPCLSVAGFISTVDQWAAFIPEWMAALGGRPYFRSAEHKHDAPLVRALVGVVSGRAPAKFGTSISFSTFRNLYPLTPPETVRLNAYALCASQCIEKVYRWAAENQIPQERIRFVFEQGDPGQGLLMNLMDANGYPPVDFEFKKDTIVKGRLRNGVVPLQAADLIAHDLFIATRNAGDDDDERVVLSFRELENKPGHVGRITKQMVVDYIEYLRATQNLGPALWIL